MSNRGKEKVYEEKVLKALPNDEEEKAKALEEEKAKALEEEKAKALEEEKAKALEEETKKKIAIFIVAREKCKKLNLREQPDITSKVIDILDAGEELIVETVSENWAYVCTKNNLEGYVMMAFVEEK